MEKLCTCLLSGVLVVNEVGVGGGGGGGGWAGIGKMRRPARLRQRLDLRRGR